MIGMPSDLEADYAAHQMLEGLGENSQVLSVNCFSLSILLIVAISTCNNQSN